MVSEKAPRELDGGETLDLSVIQSQVSIAQVGSELTDSQKEYILRRLDFEGLDNLDNLPPQAAYIINKVQDISIPESVKIVEQAVQEYRGDVNVLNRDYEFWENLINEAPKHESGIKASLSKAIGDEKEKHQEAVVEEKSHSSITSDAGIYSHPDYWYIVDWDLQIRVEATLIYYWSPYTQIRAIIDPYDVAEPCETFRVYLSGIIFSGCGMVLNQFFVTRQPAISISVSLIQVLMYPAGMFMAWAFPHWKFRVWRWTIDLNPGPWSRKEQMLATLFFSVTGVAYSNYNIHVQKLDQYYGDKWVDFGYMVLLTLSLNFLGFGIAGIVRKYAVYPVDAVWPQFLNTIALNKGLLSPERKETINGWRISRYKFFFVAFIIAFVYQWFPNYIMPFLSNFAWLSWISPNNLDLSTVTGFNTGVGINPIPTFDPNVIGPSWMYLPLAYSVNNYMGMLLAAFIILGVYYSNHRWTKYIPIFTNQLYNNKGVRYNVRKVLNDDNLFDKDKYEKYGPPFFSAASLVNYGAFFMLYPFGFFYESMVSWNSIKRALKRMFKTVDFKNWRNIKSGYDGFDDPFCRQNSKYEEVPEYVYLAVLVISLVLGIVCLEYYPTNVSCWVIFMALAFNLVFLIPILAVYSRTGFSWSLNVLIELIVGYAVPGNANAINIAKAYAVTIDGQAENYVSNQKLAHYMRIPPRSLFRTQIVAVFITSFVQLGIMQFQLGGGIKDYCDPLNKQKFTCPGINTFFSASIQWGVIGPRRTFNGLYPVLPYLFLLGFVLVFPCFAIKKYLQKKKPSWSRLFQPTIWIGGVVSLGPPVNLSYNTGGFYLNLLFMGYIFKRYSAWWKKYVYLLADAFVAGIALSTLLVFFCLQYHDVEFNWWGSNVTYAGLEGEKVAHLNATLQAPDGYFGPRAGHYP